VKARLIQSGDWQCSSGGTRVTRPIVVMSKAQSESSVVLIGIPVVVDAGRVDSAASVRVYPETPS